MKNTVIKLLNYIIKTRRTYWFTATSKTKARYARTSLGSFWLGISTLFTVMCLGFVYGTVLNVLPPTPAVAPQPQSVPEAQQEQEESQESDDIAISPIGIPLIAGPGAITATMLLSSQTPQIYSYATLGFAITIVLSIVYIILRNGTVLIDLLGTSVMRIIQRLMGLILLVIAVQFVINGVLSIIKPLI